LSLCAKDLFVAARTVRHELQGIMRRAQVAAIRRVQQTSRSIQARRAENGADRYGHQPFFGLRYGFGIGRRDRATS